MVGQRLVDPPERGVEPSLVVEVDEQLADVPGRIRHGPRVGVVEIEHLAVLGLERVRARRRRADDPVAPPGVVRENVEVGSRPAASARVEAVADHRQTAADLVRDDDLQAVPAKHVDRGKRDVGLVVVRRAAVEQHDCPIRRRLGGGIAPPGPDAATAACAKRTPAAGPDDGSRPPTRSASGSSPSAATSSRSARSRPRRARRGRSGPAASRGTAAAGPPGAAPGHGCSSRRSSRRPGRRSCRRHSRSTSRRSRPANSSDATPGAAGARSVCEPEPLGLRPDVFRAREGVGDAGDRADRVADVALQAVVGRQADFECARLEHEVLDRHRTRDLAAPPAVASTADPPSVAAARRPLAIATPSPHRSVR